MARFPLVALMAEVLSLISLQQQLFQYVHTLMWDIDDTVDSTVTFQAMDCLLHRGESGKWVRDWKYTQSAMYPIEDGVDGRSNSFENEGSPFRGEASWRWHDASGCDVIVTDKKSWCKVMSDLNISHVYLAGDSTMMDFSKSLKSMLFEGSPPNDTDTHFSKLPCGQYLSTTVLYHIQSDTNREPPFLTESGSGRKLVLFNIGAGIQRMDNFERNLTEFTEWIDEWRRPNDIIFFRSLVPARKLCTPCCDKAIVVSTKGDDIAPSASIHSERAECREIEQSLHQRRSFNEYARQLSAEYRIRYLNVYNSTILGSDDTLTSTDPCEDDFHSGRVEWWVHFLYSSLLDVSKLEEMATQRFSRR